jgi:hypothetical protein
MQLKAHARRAKLEGNLETFKRLTKGRKYSRHDKTALFTDPSAAPRQQWRFARNTCDAAFLTDADVHAIIPREADHSRKIFQIIGKSGGVRLNGNAMVPPMVLDFHKLADPAYSQLDHELREARYWDRSPKASVLQPRVFTLMFDLRWCFRTVVSAKDYFPVLRQKGGEDRPGVALKTRATAETLPCLAGADESVETFVLRGVQQQVGSLGENHVINVLFRVGRVCGKVYAGYLDFDGGGGVSAGGGKKGGKNGGGGSGGSGNEAASSDAYDKALLALADRAVSRTLEAIREPTSLRVV